MDFTRPTQLMKKHGLSNDEIALCYDGFLTYLFKKPCFSLMKLDDIFHATYGDYESEGKNMKNIFENVFGNDSDELKPYFLLEIKDGKNSTVSR